VVAPGQPALAEIAALWPDVIAADGRLERKRLGARVFADPAARKLLEAITHPRIRERAFAEAAEREREGHRLAFYEAALLVEAGRRSDFDGLVVVTADEEQQLARVMARDGCSREDALARLRAQLPLAEKRRQATHVIDNGGDLAATRRQVEALVAELRAHPSGEG
jgi:dephospho-CoA kinase